MKSLIPILLLALALFLFACPKPAETPPTPGPGVTGKPATPPAPPQAKPPAPAPAGKKAPAAADLVATGEKLFADKTLGKSGTSCSNCHPGVKDLTGVAAGYPKKVGGKELTLEGKINQMIKTNLSGMELGKDDPKMKALVAYVKAYKKVAKPTPNIPQAQ